MFHTFTQAISKKLSLFCVVTVLSVARLFAQVPTITSFSPATGPVGTLVTISGTNLTTPTAFTIGGQSAIVVSNTGSTLVAMVMPNAATGTISLSTAGGTAISSSNFTITGTPYPAVQQGSKLVATGNTGAPRQGISIAVSADGNTAIVGGFGDNSFQGAAWVYTRSGGVWTQQGTKLVGTGNVGAANQGDAVSLSADGNTAIVGGYGDNSNQGAAWVYTRSGGVWTQQGAKLVGTGNTGNARQGWSVSLSADGNTAIVGGFGDNSNQGAAWVYTRSGGAWSQLGTKLVGTGNVGAASQGYSVSLSADGNTAIVGGYGDNSNQGAVWVYTLSGGVWSQQGAKLVGTDNTGVAEQGVSVSLSADGNTAVVGGNYDNNNLGAAWVYTRSGGVWAQQGAKLVGTGAIGTANQGYSVSLSADGNTAIVSGFEDNSNMGAAWVYTRSGGTWTQRGTKLVGTGATGGSWQGYSVSLSADGSTAMVGGYLDNLNNGAAWAYIQVIAPTTQATNVTFANATFANATTAATTVSWTNGNGTSRAVFISAATSGSPAPVDLTTYTANAAFGSGTQIGTTGWYCVYNGTGTSVNITGLTVGTSYQVMTVEYNGTSGNEKYLTTAGTGNPANETITLPPAPTTQATNVTFANATFANATTAATTVSWTNGNGTSRAVFISAATSGSPAPVDLTTYTANTAFGSGNQIGTTGWYCVYNGTATSVNITGLTVGTSYQVMTVEYNGTPGIEKYLTTAGTGNPASETITLPPAPTITSFSPATGPAGTLVTINGTNLTGPTAFTIGGQPAIAVSNTGSTLVAMVMANAATGTVVLSTVGGTATGGSNFTVTATPYPSMQQGAKLVGTGNVGAANQGYTVSLSADGNTAIVGGYNDNSGQGAAWVYSRSGGVWAQQGAKLVGTGGDANSNQGTSVSLSADGNTAIVGGYNDNGGQGAAWVYTRSGGIWTQQGSKLVSSDGDGSAQQGNAVSLSADGNTALVGGNYNNGGEGAAWIYTRSGGIWTQQGTMLVGTGDDANSSQGQSVSLSADGNTAIVGGLGDNNYQGAAWVYTLSGGSWIQQGAKLVGTGNTGRAQQGYSVSLSADGNTAMVGGNGDNSRQGAAWVYTRSGTTWTQQGSKLVGTGGTGAANQGYSVSLSADGNTAIVGGAYNSSSQGAAWVYTRSGSTWSQQGTKIVGTGNVGAANQGYSVSLSADGSTAMVGGLNDNHIQGAAWAYMVLITPTTQATNLTFASTTTTVTSASWTNGNGTSRAVFISAATSGSPAPVDATTYTANTVFGSGTQIGTTGWYCVYNGTAATVNLTGLTAATTYRVMTVEYNGTPGYEKYLTTAGTGNPANITTLGPVISTTGTLSALSATYGSASASGTFNVSGTNLTAGILVTPPAGFEVSADNSTFSGTVTIGAAGTIASTPVYIRLMSTDVVASYSGNVVLSSAGATGVNVATVSSTVTKAVLTIAGNNASKVYSAANPTLAVTYTGFVGTDNAASLTTQPTVSTTAVTSSPVGTYPITASGATSSNYSISYTAGTLTVTQAALTIAANNASKVYGATNPTLAVTYTGFVGTDNAASLTTQPTISTTAVTGSAVGTYPITVNGATSSNYSISYTAGTLTVTQAALTISADNKTRVISTANPTLTATYTGFVGTDNAASLTTQPTLATTALLSSSVGSYPITASGAASPNYTISYTAGTLTVTASPNANLANLSLSSGTLSPTFAQATTAYTASVANAVTSVTLTPTTADPTSTVKVNGVSVTSGNASQSIPLAVGANTITTVITAQNGTTIITYTTTVTRAPSSNAGLANLVISNGTLSPAFTSSTYVYTTLVDNTVSQFSLTPTLADPTATILINGQPAANATQSGLLNLLVGDNTITVVTTAQDGSTKLTYTITVHRATAPSATQASNILSPNGDGKNDTWIVKDILSYPNNTVTIYDRAGRVVYTKHTYTNDWSGTFQGAPLAEGTYYYVIDLGTGDSPKKGFITILRQR